MRANANARTRVYSAPMRRTLYLSSFVLFGCSLMRCVGDTTVLPDGGSDATTSDAPGSDAPIAEDVQQEPPASGFTMTLSPLHVTADVGDPAATVSINVLRASGFTDDVSFTITPPGGVTASTAPDTGNGGNSSSFTLTVGSGASMGEADVSVTGQNPSKSSVVTQHLGLRIGSALDVSTGVVTIPSYATSVTVKAWGAGGGSSFTYSGGYPSLGGAGGYATFVLTVVGGEQLAARVGTGGGAGPSDFSGAGGGGGG